MITFDQVPLDKATAYAAEDADLTLRLYQYLKPQLLATRKNTVYETLERPLVPVLVDMEQAGILVDRAELARLSADFATRIVTLEGQIHELAGESFNVNSPKQLGEILFDKMSLPGGKKTKTGAYGTGADVLEGLAAQGHDLPVRVLEYRQLAKLKSTYTDALQNQINATTGRVHTSYAMAATSTGRLASTDPNLQNIPVRTEEGRRIRKAFIAAPGHKLLSADYSQIELRILAHIADITALRQAFHDGLDIHAMTAAQVFDLPIEDMDPMIRRRAKAINFGIIYGISAFGLANNLGIERGEAQAYINAYFERYPGIRDYMEKTKASCRELGYVETIHGRRVHMPGINDKNGARRGFHERAAINAPIQGSAADVIRRAMVAMPGALAGAKLDARMLLQVHDELIFEVPEEQIDETVTVAKRIMEGAAHLSVPLTVDAGIGDSWAEAH
jgi:DNA polymerase-1